MRIHPEAQDRNDRLHAVAPAVLEALSPLGKRAFFPKGIPFQAGQAAGCRINATIGQITDGAGNPIPLAPLAEKLAGLPPKDAFLYSPIQGRDRARKTWHAKLTKEDARVEPLALPVVSAGICNALSMAADLFFAPGDTLILPDLYWDNYEQIFLMRLEGEYATFPFYGADGSGFNLEGLRGALAARKGKAHVLLNFPSNPSGYSPTPAELKAIGDILVEAAKDRQVVVYCDDAYHGLVFEEAHTTKSLFFELIGRSPNLIPLKCDGVTKELSFFGGRVGFLTFGVAKAAAEILVDKAMSLVRSSIGSPVGLSQFLVEEELLDARHEGEFERLRQTLAARYRLLKAALGRPTKHWKVFPFNAGCFCLLELRVGLDAEAVRQALIADESVGVVSQQDRYLRLAFCSLKEDAIEPLVAALDRVCARL
ncbi:MAG TPA: aminotransferase class I/II-fold pyridoxal phosphate-dependent enzyme [Holophagaceae bacterium]|nr:aminotransferase class I/II-fold pyridoxal phosphate-dependent enzyme [Holophagaceae bacterium]